MNAILFDYGAGNLHSLKKALEAGGVSVTVSSSWLDALSGDALVLPGVGSFGAAVRTLDGKRRKVREALEAGLPTLGICLGMQMLFQESEEGEGQGIGLFPGRVRVLRSRIVPQMGWNDVTAGTDPLFRGIRHPVVYYANSYVCTPEDPGAVIAVSEYEGDSFPAAVRRFRTWGLQFHPEKSSEGGLLMIRNFLAEIQQGTSTGQGSMKGPTEGTGGQAPGENG